MTARHEYASHMQAVATLLLGEPAERKANELRYGTRGSLSIDLESGVWHDHEANTGGGVLALIERETGNAGRAAVDWMGQQGITPANDNTPAPRKRIAATYDYIDADGVLLFQVCRMAPKDFRQRRPDGNGGWSWSVKGVEQVPYRLPQLLARPDEIIFIVEGEKDAENLAALGLLATCNAGGANKWHASLSQHFRGRHVVILPDKDDAGRAHAQLVAGKLQGVAASVRVLELPNLPHKGDVSDWLEAGNDADELRAMAEQANALVPATDDAPILDPSQISEDALALVFEHRHADALRYCHTAGAWYAWTGNRWQKESTQLAFSWSREICRDFGNAPKFATARTASAVEKFAASSRRLAVTSEVWDSTPWLLGTPGGTVDLRTGELRRANQGDHITRQTATAPAATGAVPRRWLAFLEDATRGDADLIRFLRQMAGYSLTGDTSAHALFFIYGAGGNGKSVFLNTLTGILGEYAQTAAMDTFTASSNDKHPTDLAGLKGARLVSASETEDGRAWAETRIKNMTGGDPITARFMRRDFFTYTPEFKLVIVGNHKPRLNNVDDATKRRFNIIPFVHRPTTPNPELEKELREEWPAILRWAIDGCLDWQKNGLVRPAVVVDATREYFEDQDVFGQWLEECCEREPQHKDTSAELFSSWKRYAETAGERAGNTTTFGEAMRKRGFANWRTKSARGFDGIRVIPRAAAHDPRFPDDWNTDPERPF
ncbi:phage/plasmid primase, P4 family [Ralstonia solanacearum]|nr:phage/plasmid primase, P4 family [Ralstonia solanacearum]